MALAIREIFYMKTVAFGTPVGVIFLSFVVGVVGGAVSMAMDFAKIFSRGDPTPIALTKIVLRPLFGGYLAAFAFSFLSGDYLKSLIPQIFQVSLNGLTPNQLFYVVLSMSFLFGFAERFPSTSIEKATEMWRRTASSRDGKG